MTRAHAGNLPGGQGNPRCIYFLVTTVIRRLNVIRNVPTSAAPLSIKTITNGPPNCTTTCATYEFTGTRIALEHPTVYETDAPVCVLRTRYARLFRASAGSTT